MELSVARNLISKGFSNISSPQLWADFGAGEGLFTKALSTLLPEKSKIIAIDKDEGVLKSISITSGVVLQTIAADLNSLPKDLPLFDGVILANALHYIPEQSDFLRQLKSNYLKASGALIIIEYDLEKSNPWVPYPISRKKITQLAQNSRFQKPAFIGSVESKLNSSEIYSALLKP
jgi:ubiquinone/menaquinone biosynthesis C-methylase UbiE